MSIYWNKNFRQYVWHFTSITQVKKSTKSRDDFLRDHVVLKSRDLICTKMSCLCCYPNHIISYWIDRPYTWCLMVLIISLMMARISTDNRGRAIGLLQVGVLQRKNSHKNRRLHFQQSSVARLCKMYERTGKSMFRWKLWS